MARKKGVSTPKESLLAAAKKIEKAQTKPDLSGMPAKTETPEIILEKPYKCVMCGTRYTRQRNYFSFSQSPFFKGNNSYLPICNSCLVYATEQYEALLGDPDEAIRRMCLHWDIYLNETTLGSSKRTNGSHRIRDYVRQCNLQQNAGRTYDDYLYEQSTAPVLSRADIEDMEETDAKRMQRNITKWGLGYNEQEYDLLNNHYKALKAQINTDDPIQESLVRDLCDMQVMKLRARQDKDIDRYDKISKLYQNTLSTANLKPTTTTNSLDENDPSSTWGCFIRDIEKYTPAEYFKNKNKFKDADGILGYVNRHMYRPMKNWILGTKDKDPEYSITGDDEDQA